MTPGEDLRARVAERVAEVRTRIAAAGGEDRVRLVAVTKGFGPDAAEAALAAGVVDLGESYAQELVDKASALRARGVPSATAGELPRWHFVGRVQTNKVRLVGPLVSLWQSVDRTAVGDELARRVPGARVLVQVNVTGEEQKAGCRPGEVASLVAGLRDRGLEVLGLMAIGPAGRAEAARPGFRLLASLADELALPERSMGMTGDLEVAVEEGATIVRIGRGLFGERPRPPATGPRD